MGGGGRGGIKNYKKKNIRKKNIRKKGEKDILIHQRRDKTLRDIYINTVDAVTINPSLLPDRMEY